MHVANYHEQRGRLAAIADPANEAVAFVVTGPAEFGKTWLVDWLEAEARDAVRLVRIEMDHPQRTLSPRLIMTICAQTLGYGHFEAFRQETLRQPAAQATVENVTINGSYNNVTAAAGGSLEDQLALAVSLTASFLEGLEVAAADGAPIIICLDGLKPDQWLCLNWLEVSLLDALVRTGAARVVLTSREPLSAELMRKARDPAVIALTGVHDIDEWRRIADALKLSIGATDEIINAKLEAVVEVANGEPGRIMTWLQGRPRRAAS